MLGNTECLDVLLEVDMFYEFPITCAGIVVITVRVDSVAYRVVKDRG